MKGYLRILSHPPAAWPFFASVLARLPISMLPLGMVLLAQQVRGSYGAAGAATAAFAISTAVTSPIWGRLVDLLGQPRVVALTSLTSGAFVVAFALAAVLGASTLVLVGLAAGAGLAFPPITAAMRGAWRVVLHDPRDLRAAYALDPVAIETMFVIGPLAVSALLVLTPPVVPLLVTAALLSGGGVAYSLTGAARAWRAGPPTRSGGRSPLRARGVVPVLVVTLAMSVGFGQLDVAIPATARLRLGDAALVGVMFMCIAGASATGGLIYGSRGWRRPERLRLPITLAGFAGGLVVLSVLLANGEPGLSVLAVALIVTGAWIAPGLIALANLVDHLAPADRLGEAQSWLSTGFTSGGALGAALAGVLIDRGGPAWAFWGASLAVLAAVLLAVLSQPLLRAADAHG